MHRLYMTGAGVSHSALAGFVRKRYRDDSGGDERSSPRRRAKSLNVAAICSAIVACSSAIRSTGISIRSTDAARRSSTGAASILSTLERNHWQHGVSAGLLGINRRTLYRKLKRYREEGHLAEVPEG